MNIEVSWKCKQSEEDMDGHIAVETKVPIDRQPMGECICPAVILRLVCALSFGTVIIS